MTATASTSRALRKLPFSRLTFFGALLLAYVIGYFVLMDRRAPAVERGKGGSHRIWYQSSFRFAPRVDGYPASTAWNAIYLPLDALYFAAFPSHRRWEDVF